MEHAGGEWTIRPVRPGDEEGWVEVSWARWQDTYGHHLPEDYFSEERRERWLTGWREVFEKAAAEAADGDASAAGPGGDGAAGDGGQDDGAVRPRNDGAVRPRRYVAVAPNGRIAGIALAAAPATQGHPEFEPARPVELHILYITREAQGTGMANALTESVLPDNEPAQLWVSADNARAQGFYRKVGFLPDGAEGVYNEMIPEIRMVR